FDSTTGTPDLIDSPFGPHPNWRQQINSVTSYIDASNVYGSDEVRAAALRTFVDGKLEISPDGLLPLNTDGLANDDPLRLGSDLYLAGDVRANEQVALTALHTVFVREHNRLADAIKAENPVLSDEEIYQLARRIVGAEMQIITYREFLPALLGSAAPSAGDYQYDATVDASITNSFATAIFRFGHSMQSSELPLVDADGNSQGTVSLAAAFFNPGFLGDHPDNVDLVLNGLSHQLAQENDLLLVDEIRNFLFGPPGAGGLDLAALDIQRGRDHGLPDYNSLREFYGLQRVTSFSEISSDPQVQQRLEEVYGSVDTIDAFIGSVAEDHLAGSSVGELVHAVVANQFARLRDGDRFFFEGDPVLQTDLVRRVIDIDRVSLGDILQRNTGLSSVRENVFYDQSVLYYRTDSGPTRVEVTRRGDSVAVIDSSNGHVIDSRPIDDLTQIILVDAATGRGTRWGIDASVTKLTIADGIVIRNSGNGDGVLVIRGRAGADALVVGKDHAVFNDVTVRFSGIDLLRVSGFARNDQVLVTEHANVRVVVEPMRGRRPRSDRPDRSTDSERLRSRSDSRTASEVPPLDPAEKRDHAVIDQVFDRSNLGQTLDRTLLRSATHRSTRRR
ncbi:MAG: peroxidase family protein, partial [Planctomycetaceae bacterium]